MSTDDMGPVQDVTPEVQEIASRPELKHAAIQKLHEIHRNNTIHHFTEATDMHQHIEAWTVVKHAEQQTAFGINYFLKVKLAEGMYIHIR